jgi:hypothetical protein
MDENTDLLLSVSPPQRKWEDEEKSTNDVAALRAEYRSLLYASGGDAIPNDQCMKEPERNE